MDEVKDEIIRYIRHAELQLEDGYSVEEVIVELIENVEMLDI